MVKKAEIKSNRIAEMLQTEDELEQENRVNSLIQAANAPIIHMTIIVDTRQGNVTITGTPLGYDAIYRVLDIARREIMENERQATLNKDAPPTIPPRPQPTTDPNSTTFA